MSPIDHFALLPAYAAAGTAVLAFLADLVAPGRRGVVAGATALGALATGVAAIGVGRGPNRKTFCAGDVGCSYLADHRAALIATLFAGLTLAVVALSAPTQRLGEYYFLLASAMTGGVVLGYAGDLITLIVALETLTLPLYILVALRRERVEGAVTFFVVSVVSTSVALMGAALLYAATGTVHFGRLAQVLAQRPLPPLTTVGVVLLLAGLSFKVAAVPFHAWAPSTYDSAPLPVAGYLSTASKLGGVVAILYVSINALYPVYGVVAPTLAVLAVLSMTVGNLAALRQHRMVRLLAWSSVAQAGYLLAPLAVRAPVDDSVAATLAYTFFYVLLELGAFGAVIALAYGRSDGSDSDSDRDGDGGALADYAGALRRSPWAAGALALALVGLAGLPPGLAGLFAKVVVVRALVTTGTGWLAVVVALNAVLGLAYYLRAAALLFTPTPAPAEPIPAPADLPSTRQRVRIPWPVAVALGALTLAAVVTGVAPQLVLAAVVQ
jgi:NADH-quinone oxidoreductase subunit N